MAILKTREDRIKLLFAILGALGAALLNFGVDYLNNYLADKANEGQTIELQNELKKQTREMVNQTAATQKGFASLTTALQSQGMASPDVTRIIESLSNSINALVNNTSSISTNANAALGIANFYKKYNDVPKGDREIYLSRKRNQAGYIDRNHTVGVVNEYADGNYITAQFSGKQSTQTMYVGGSDTIRTNDNKKCIVSYMGVDQKTGENYIFAVSCD